MSNAKFKNLVPLGIERPIWNRFYTVSPLVVVGSKENGNYDLAPKHMVTPLGYDNYFGFVCTPSHSTYHNIKKHKEFTVSFVKPNQVIMASLAASPRCDDKIHKAELDLLPTFPAQKVDALCIEESYLLLECKLDRIVDGFGDCSLIAGEIIAAYVDEDALRVSEGDDGKMIQNSPMLAYLPYGRFAEIKETFAFPFPKGFSVTNLVNENS